MVQDGEQHSRQRELKHNDRGLREQMVISRKQSVVEFGGGYNVGDGKG